MTNTALDNDRSPVERSLNSPQGFAIIGLGFSKPLPPPPPSIVFIVHKVFLDFWGDRIPTQPTTPHTALKTHPEFANSLRATVQWCGVEWQPSSVNAPQALWGDNIAVMVVSEELVVALTGAKRSTVLPDMPLLVVQVVSPGQENRDYRYKRSEYAARGIGMGGRFL